MLAEQPVKAVLLTQSETSTGSDAAGGGARPRRERRGRFHRPDVSSQGSVPFAFDDQSRRVIGGSRESAVGRPGAWPFAAISERAWWRTGPRRCRGSTSTGRPTKRFDRTGPRTRGRWRVSVMQGLHAALEGSTSRTASRPRTLLLNGCHAVKEGSRGARASTPVRRGPGRQLDQVCSGSARPRDRRRHQRPDRSDFSCCA